MNEDKKGGVNKNKHVGLDSIYLSVQLNESRYTYIDNDV